MKIWKNTNQEVVKISDILGTGISCSKTNFLGELLLVCWMQCSGYVVLNKLLLKMILKTLVCIVRNDRSANTDNHLGLSIYETGLTQRLSIIIVNYGLNYGLFFCTTGLTPPN